MANHCWHKVGIGYAQANQMAGHEEYFCCWCDTRIQRRWKVEVMEDIGHGPHRRIHLRKQDALSEETCPQRQYEEVAIASGELT